MSPRAVFLPPFLWSSQRTHWIQTQTSCSFPSKGRGEKGIQPGTLWRLMIQEDILVCPWYFISSLLSPWPLWECDLRGRNTMSFSCSTNSKPWSPIAPCNYPESAMYPLSCVQGQHRGGGGCLGAMATPKFPAPDSFINNVETVLSLKAG